ncbi:hypothetical protein UFOVP1090_13 [uncultured Caudovirales phage]|uniref:Uncharacterized protein n=1 Tax=uncultured Caudovirales phage TaxID=2100421 RepID=A0A6J5QJ36_9CAUD|nr:hypothetical protein UFOVP1090_13 [uncultured Caudovirales phage]
MEFRVIFRTATTTHVLEDTVLPAQVSTHVSRLTQKQMPSFNAETLTPLIHATLLRLHALTALNCYSIQLAVE